MPKLKCLIIFCLIIGVAVIAATSSPSYYVSDSTKSSYVKKYGKQAETRLNALLRLMQKLSTATEDQKVIEVNRFFNQVGYQSDIKTWKKNDYWASRLEFLGVGLGDCEDYSVAKFLTLIQLGISDKKLFLTYVRAKGYAESAHMVVSYYQQPGTVPFVLDNYNKQILPATQRKDLVPVYSFTANDLFLQKQKGLGKRVNPSSTKNIQKLKNIDLEIHKR